MQGKIILNEHIQLDIKFVESDFVDQWVKMVRNRPKDSLVLQDNVKPTIKKFNRLRKICDKSLGWQWSSLPITQETLNLMHKDIELLKVGDDRLPAGDHPIHELHRLLHQIEDTLIQNKPHNNRLLSFQSRYHDRLPINDYSIYQSSMLPGALMLDYPYVGRSPMSAMQCNDNQSLLMTCLPALDACAGFHIMYQPFGVSAKLLAELSTWLDSAGSPIKEKYGKEIVLKTSHPAVVGHVINLEVFLATRDMIINTADVAF